MYIKHSEPCKQYYTVINYYVYISMNLKINYYTKSHSSVFTRQGFDVTLLGLALSTFI